ncbi:MAG: hypothetical protein EU548_05650 [Promethearchaeota archaeon]|nr:MAG: hypothetical protein EU548_05650 [Candidatus Lokiarchaeota archaeon]
MTQKNKFNFENIISHLKETSERKVGLICLNYLLIDCKVDDLYEFARKYAMKLPEKDFIPRLEFIKIIAIHLTNMYYTTYLQKKYENPLEHIGYTVIEDSNIKNHLKNLDFVVKQDLIDVFADYCADTGITVYNTESLKPKMDMYLAMEKPTTKTEAVLLMTGFDINEDFYMEAQSLIKEANNVANSTLFVTTPMGALKIGIRKLIFDMKRLNCWLYIVDPSRKLIFGVLKAKKNNEFEVARRNEFIKNLPREPLRAPSRLIDFSDYTFSDFKSFNAGHFRLFEIYDNLEHNKLIVKEQEQPKYTAIFRDLIIIESVSGTPIVSYTSENFKEQALTSGFLTAMDSYVSQIGGTRLKEINYKGFYVQAAYGESTKLACFLSQPADKSLKDRLNHLIEGFEKKYSSLISEFRFSGNTNLFNQNEIISFIKEILSI